MSSWSVFSVCSIYPFRDGRIIRKGLDLSLSQSHDPVVLPNVKARNPDWHLTVPFRLFLGNRFPEEVFPELDPNLTVSFLFLLLAYLKDFRVDSHVVLR